MSNDIKWQMVSDLHFPHHDPRLLNIWFDVMRWWKPDAVDLLGDIDNADSTSRWADGTTKESSSIEDEGVADTRQFLKDIRAVVPDADCHFHDGNHGWTRHEAYIDKKAPTFKQFITPDALYEYKDAGFHWHEYTKPPVRRFGDVYAHHGESISKHGGESVRNDCLNWGVSLVRGHSHRIGFYAKTYELTGQEIRGYEIGHMSDPSKLDYLTTHDWQTAFAIGHVENGNIPHIQVVEIKDYTAYVDGKKFTG